MQRWYCSVSFRWKRSPGGGVCPNGRRTRGVRRTGASLWRSKRSSSESSRSCVMLPAAETTMFTPLYIARWYAAIARLLTVEMTSAVPITGRPRACSPKTAWEKRSCTSSCGVSSYIAISSSTTSRSWSSSANRGAHTRSVITSSASSTCLSGTRENTTVCSREVAAFSSAPIASNVSAICCASYERDPLNNRCSMKCETPARSLRSSREPAPIQKPIETERTLGTFSEMTRSPESSSERTYFCTAPTIPRGGGPPRTKRAARGRPFPHSVAAPLAPAAATAATAVVPARALLLRGPRRRVLRPLDQLLRLDEVPVLVLRDELEADPAASLVDLLHDDVDDVASRHHVLDVAHAARTHVGDVEQAVRALLQLDERAELRRLDDLAGVRVTDLRLLRQVADRGNRGLGLLAVGCVDQDRAVLLAVDLHLVVGLEAADRLAALAGHETDLLLLDLDRRAARRVLRELGAGLRNHVEHHVEDRVAGPIRLFQRASHDLLRDARDLDVHLEGGDALAAPGDLEVHVAEVVLRTLDIGEDHVVVAFLDETHRDARHRRLDRHAGIHECERRAAHRGHRRGAVRLERLRDDADRVGELRRRRNHRFECALCERTVADVAPLRAPHEARLPDRVRREVVVVHVAAIGLEREVVDPLAFLRRAEREGRQHLRLAAREEAGAVCTRVDADLDLDRTDLLGAAAVGPPLVDRDLLADEILVDRLGRLLDVVPRQAVLDCRALAVDRRRADREGQLDACDDVLEEQVALGRLQLLRVLLGVRERTQVGLELLAHRAFDRDETLLLEQHVHARADLRLVLDVLLGRVHRHLARELRRELVDDRGRLAQADALDALPDRVPVSRLELLGELHVEPLRLARLAAQVLLGVTQLANLAVGQLERLEEHVLGHLVGPGLDHRQAVLRSDDDQVERRLRPVLLKGRVDHELAVDAADPHGSDGPEERQRRDHQRRRRAVDAQDVVRGDEIRRQHGADHLHFVPEALRPQRPDRAVDHPGGQGCALAGAALALEEAAGDLAGGVHALLDVDRQREEVRAFAGLGPADCRGEHHRLATADDDGAVRLLRELACLERDLLVSNLDGDPSQALGRDTHSIVLHSASWRAGV